jgi:hypothetical protein
MAEQTFKSPGFFEREIEVIKRPVVSNTATPVGLVGPAKKGPAFVPTTVYSQDEFIRIFGEPDRRMLSGHAAAEFFRNNGQALTFCRTLGSGHWGGTSIVNAGFKLTHTDGTDGDVGAGKLKGAVHFITAKHKVANSEFLSLGLFSDNDSHTTVFDSDRATGLAEAASDGEVELIRAMIFTHKDYTVKIDDHDGTEFADDLATTHNDGTFKLRFTNRTDDVDKVVSLNPDRDDYISKVLNTDALSLDSEKHYLYAHFAVDNDVASPVSKAVAVLHGKTGYEDEFGDFSSAFIAPETPSFISQPFGTKEYDLFHFESLDDGAYASDKYKVSISNLRASTDPTDKFGTFSVAIRDLRDSDESPVVYESYNNCSLNPDAVNFVGRIIGDQKVYYSYNNSDDNEKRLVREGAFSNVSTRIRVVVSDDVMLGEVPETALPFGFRGVEALLTNSTATDIRDANSRLTGVGGVSLANTHLDHSVLPPLPYRFKVTKGSIKTNASYAQTFTGEASASESVDLNLHWGLNSRRVKEIDNPNGGTYEFNELLANYLKFMGADSAVKTSGTLSDSHNNNKFSLAKVSLNKPDMDSVSGTINDVFKDAVYIRNADPSSTIYDAATHTIDMTVQEDNLLGVSNGLTAAEKAVTVTLAKLLAEDPIKFNKYSLAAKFTAPFSGGFDGLNIFDSDSYYMTDKGSAIKEGGKASSTGFSSPVKNTSTEADDAATSADLMQGFENTNNVVASFKNAIRLMTDGMVVNHNVLVVPGIRDAFITDFAKQRVEEYGKAIYLMDIPYYDKSATRTFVSEKGVASERADVEETSSRFDLREINSSYVAAYFPDALVLDSGDPDDAAIDSRRSIRVPSSIVALGALAKTDSISSPWFAPAGFSRGALDTITSTCVRLNAADRDTLYEARINPIANFPNKQFVIFGQKTSQLARTALDRVNVRRLVLEVKRQIERTAQGLLFEQNNSSTRNRFVSAAANSLSTIRAGKGIEDFRVIMDDTNNTAEDVDNNRLNGRIVIVPTRAIEFVAIDFVITNAGVEFP